MALDDTSTAWLDAVTSGDTTEAARLEAVLETARQLEELASSSLLEEARGYAYAGIAVFPLVPRGKVPLTTNGFKNASTDLNDILSWWQRWPDANIGLPTGHQFDVIDIDGEAGARLWAQGRFADIPLLGHALTTRQAGHHLYVPPTGRGNTAAIQPGVDWRGIGGYVVAPPSIGPNGNRYTWLHPLELP